jgi:hypothetical protein
MEGHDDSQRSDGLAVTQRDERCEEIALSISAMQAMK